MCVLDWKWILEFCNKYLQVESWLQEVQYKQMQEKLNKLRTPQQPLSVDLWDPCYSSFYFAVLYLYFACPCYVSLAEQQLNTPPVFSGDLVTRSLVVCVMFCRSLFVLLSFFFWPLCCQFFFNLRILITSLLSYVSLDCPIVIASDVLAYVDSLTLAILY